MKKNDESFVMKKLETLNLVILDHKSHTISASKDKTQINAEKI